MIFDQTKIHRWRDMMKATAPDYFNDLDLTPSELDFLEEYMKQRARDKQLVERFLGRAA